MKIVSLVPQPREAVGFTFFNIRSLPVEPGCYVLTNASGDIIYLGQAESLRNRLIQHFDSGRHRINTCYGCISLVSVVVVDSYSQLNAHERGWLNQCVLADGVLPPLNKANAPNP